MSTTLYKSPEIRPFSFSFFQKLLLLLSPPICIHAVEEKVIQIQSKVSLPQIKLSFLNYDLQLPRWFREVEGVLVPEHFASFSSAKGRQEGGLIHLPSARPEHAGEYICRANNSHSADQAVISLSVTGN